MSYEPYSCAESPAHELAEELIQTISGALSIFGSSLIVCDVLKNHFGHIGIFQRLCSRGICCCCCGCGLCGAKDVTNGTSAASNNNNNGRRQSAKKKSTDAYQRIMLGLSFFDLCHSFFDSFMGSWLTPAETGWWHAAGNQATCSAQGFFTAFGYMGCYGYQMALSLNILLLITFSWSQTKFAQIIEKPMHVFIFLIALAYGVVPLPLEGYNPGCGQCIWTPLWDTCDSVETVEKAIAITSIMEGGYEYIDPNDGSEEEFCVVRGSEQLQFIYWEIMWSCLWIMIIFCSGAMISVFLTVRRQENRMKRYSFAPRETNRDDISNTISNTATSRNARRRSSVAAGEAHHRESVRIRKILLLYTLSLLICWGIPFTIIFISVELDEWPWGVPFGIRAVIEALIPLCGFCNMLVYFLPKCLNYQMKNPEICLFSCYIYVLFGVQPCPRNVCSQCHPCMMRARRKETDELVVQPDQEISGDDDNDNDDEGEQIDQLFEEFSMNFSEFNVSITKHALGPSTSRPPRLKASSDSNVNCIHTREERISEAMSREWKSDGHVR